MRAAISLLIVLATSSAQAGPSLRGRVATMTQAVGRSLKKVPAQLGIGTSTEGVDDTKATPLQRALAVGQAASGGIAIASMEHLDKGWHYAAAAGLAYAGYQAADFAGGLVHWGLDNYGTEHTPLVGAQVRDFQTHHDDPRAVGRRSVPGLIAPLTLVGIPAALALAAMGNHDFALKALELGFGAGFVLNPVGHKYTHQSQKTVGPVVKAMRAVGLYITPKDHLEGHHDAPFGAAYGVLSGKTNPLADRLQIHRKLEKAVYYLSGKKAIPNDWKEKGGRAVMEAALGPEEAAKVVLPPEKTRPPRPVPSSP